jgi:hypothetical protein
MLITIERHVETDGAYEKLYGLPFPFISNNYAFTNHSDLYVLPMFIDLILYLSLVLLCFILIQRIGILKTHLVFVLFGSIIVIFWICLSALITFESTFKLTNDFSFKITSSHFHFGPFP